MRVYMSDIRKAKMCASGARSLATRLGYDWQDFLKNGIDIKELEKINDAMVQQVVEVAKNGRK